MYHTPPKFSSGQPAAFQLQAYVFSIRVENKVDSDQMASLEAI